MSRVIRNPARAAAAGLAAVLFIGTVGLFLGAPPSSRLGTVAIGIAASLLASFVFAIVDGLLVGSRRRELQENLESVAESAARLKCDLMLLAKAEEHRIELVKPKVAYSDDEWLALLRGAQHSLTMIGHALDKWCEGEIKQEFCMTIRRIVANGGEVRLVMLAEGASRVARLRSKGYTERIQRTLKVLAELHPQLNGPGKLSVYHLGDKLDMPYMAVANERVMIAAPYPAATQSSNRMPAVVVSCESEIAKQLHHDIDVLIEGSVTKAKLIP
jgi:hypothetical protein